MQEVPIPDRYGGVIAVGDELLLMETGNGKQIATGGADNQVKVRGADLESPPTTLQTHTGPISSVAFSPNNKAW